MTVRSRAGLTSAGYALNGISDAAGYLTMVLPKLPISTDSVDTLAPVIS